MNQWHIRIRGRVMGPFSLPQLREMKDRGQLQSFHEVSTDRATWKLAGSLGELYPQTSISKDPWTPAPPPPPPPPEKAPRSKSGLSPAVILLAGGAVVLIAIMVVVVAVLAVFMGRKSNQSATEIAQGADSSGMIHFEADTPPAARYDRVKHAVGFVVCGYHEVQSNGAQIEMPLSSGSCFAVTKDGYLLTNKHVVESIDNAGRSRKISLGVLTLKGTYDGVHLPKPRNKYYDFKFLLLRAGQPAIVDVYYRYKDKDQDEGSQTTPKVWVFFSRSEKFPAQIKYVSPNYDLAVLKIDRLTDQYFAVSERSPKDVTPGLDVTAWGYPGIQEDILDFAGSSESVKPRAGPVEGYFRDERFLPIPEKGAVRTEPYLWKKHKGLRDPLCIDHTASIFHGNSGGPLLLADGSVIGINTYGHTLGKDDDVKKVNLSITMLQIKDEIDRYVGDVVWK